MGKTSNHLYRRGKIWWCWVYDTNRKVRRTSTRCTDQEAARRFLRDAERNAMDPVAGARSTTTLKDVLDLALASVVGKATGHEARRSLATVEFYRKKVKQLLSGFPDGCLASHFSGPAAVDAYITKRRKVVKEATIHKELVPLRVGLRLAKRAGRWHGDLAATFPERGEISGASKPRERWLPVEEIRRLVAALDEAPQAARIKSDAGEEYRAQLVAAARARAGKAAFMWATGCEVGALTRATRSLTTETMAHVPGTKRALRDRSVPVLLPVQREMLKFAIARADGDGDLLFAPWKNVRHDLLRACRRAGIDACSPNDLRRSFAQLLRGALISPALIAGAMGHADSRMVERVYGRLSAVDLAKAMNASLAQSAGRPRPDEVD